jgi:hypothetical protein
MVSYASKPPNSLITYDLHYAKLQDVSANIPEKGLKYHGSFRVPNNQPKQAVCTFAIPQSRKPKADGSGCELSPCIVVFQLLECRTYKFLMNRR